MSTSMIVNVYLMSTKELFLPGINVYLYPRTNKLPISFSDATINDNTRFTNQIHFISDA